MRICKFPGSFTENDYQQILSLLEDAGTKSKSRRIDFSVCIFIFICIRYVRGKKTKMFYYYYYYFLLYAHKFRAHFLIFLKSLKFLKPSYFLKYKSNVLKHSYKKHWEQSGFLPFPSPTSFRFHKFVFC